MITLQIEHQVRDFGMWRRAFDSDPLNRAASGVRSYRISRPLDQEDYVMLEMDFETQAAGRDPYAHLQHGSVRHQVRHVARDAPLGAHLQRGVVRERQEAGSIGHAELEACDL